VEIAPGSGDLVCDKIGKVYPNGKKALDAITKGLIPLIKGPDREMAERTLANKVDQRLKVLLACARSKSAEEYSEPDSDAQVEASIVEAVKEAEASGEVV